MAINTTITGNGVSTSTNPTEAASVVVIRGTGKGKVIFQISVDDVNWVDLNDEGGAFSVSTPDVGLYYRFKAVNVTGNASIYFGA